MEVSRAPPAVQALRQGPPASTSHHNLALRGQASAAAPGRILNEAYESFGRLAESHANRAGYRLGLGPVAAVERIQKFMGEGLERESRLQEISNNPSPKLRRDCSKLIGYAFPSESSRTQLEAFKGIVTLVTRYSALRRVFLECKNLQGIEISADIISESWRRPDGNDQAQVFTFYLQFSAACIAGKDIAPMMEDNPPYVLWSVESVREGLSVVERLLVAFDCEGTSDFPSQISVRYLGGILECPSFWAQIGPMFEAIVKKILVRAAAVLKDLGVDCAEDLDSAEPISDAEGIDILCESVLNGVQSQIQDCSNQDLRTQYWYPGLSDIIQLLRHPRTESLLPRSWVRATSAEMKLMIPTTYVSRSVNIPVLPVLVGSDPTLFTPSIRPRRKRMARLWRALRSNVTPNNNVDMDNAEPGEIIPPSALSPPSGPNSSVNNADSARSSQLLHSSRSSLRIGSPVFDDELMIPSAALDISDNESEEFNLPASSTDHTALPRSLPRSVTIPTPENIGHPLQMTSPVATAAGLVDHSISAAMGERLNDVGIGYFERHLDTVPMRPDRASTIGDLPVTIPPAENAGHHLQMSSPVATAAGLADRSSSAAMAQSRAERLNDVGIGDFERHLDTVPIRPESVEVEEEAEEEDDEGWEDEDENESQSQQDARTGPHPKPKAPPSSLQQQPPPHLGYARGHSTGGGSNTGTDLRQLPTRPTHRSTSSMRTDWGPAIGDLPVPSAHSENGLFSKLPPDTYNNATALASARVGALSILLKSEPEASAEEENNRAQSSIITQRQPGSSPRRPGMMPRAFSNGALPSHLGAGTSGSLGKSSVAGPVVSVADPHAVGGDPPSAPLAGASNTTTQNGSAGRSGGYHPKGPPAEMEYDDEEDEESDVDERSGKGRVRDEGLQLSKSVAEEKLRLLAEKNGRATAIGFGGDLAETERRRLLYEQAGVVPWAAAANDHNAVDDHHVAQQHPNRSMPTAPVGFPYNLPLPAPPSTPRTTRQHMLRNEMSESLRYNLLWQHKLNRTDTGLQPRRTNSTRNVPGAEQQAEKSLVRVMLRVPGVERRETLLPMKPPLQGVAPTKNLKKLVRTAEFRLGGQF